MQCSRARQPQQRGWRTSAVGEYERKIHHVCIYILFFYFVALQRCTASPVTESGIFLPFLSPHGVSGKENREASIPALVGVYTRACLRHYMNLLQASGAQLFPPSSTRQRTRNERHTCGFTNSSLEHTGSYPASLTACTTSSRRNRRASFGSLRLVVAPSTVVFGRQLAQAPAPMAMAGAAQPVIGRPPVLRSSTQSRRGRAPLYLRFQLCTPREMATPGSVTAGKEAIRSSAKSGSCFQSGPHPRRPTTQWVTGSRRAPLAACCGWQRDRTDRLAALAVLQRRTRSAGLLRRQCSPPQPQLGFQTAARSSSPHRCRPSPPRGTLHCRHAQR